jgi:multidrug resistance protein, MATE family
MIFKRFPKKEIIGLLLNSWSLSWPMIIIMLIDFLVGITDVYIAGRLTKEVQASVGFVTQLYLVIIVIGNALTVGAVSIISRLFGANKKEELSSAVITLSAASLCLGAFVGVLALTFSSPIIRMLNIPVAIREFGLPLFRIYSIGIVFHFFLIASNGILRGCRMVKRSLVTMLIVCAVNISLNFILVFHTGVGFRGIIISTVVSYAAGAILNFVGIRKLIANTRRFSWNLLKSMTRIGWPTGLQQIAWQIGSTMLFLIISALPYNTVETIAAFTNGLRIEAAIYVIAYALNNANAVVIGNLIGEGRQDIAFKNGIATAFIGVAIITVQTVLVIINAGPFSAALSLNSIVINESMRYLHIAMLSEPFMAWAVIISGGLIGAGDTRSVMKVVVLSQWLVRLPAAYFAAVYFNLGPSAIWWAMNASILVHAIFISVRYFKKGWMKIKI